MIIKVRTRRRKFGLRETNSEPRETNPESREMKPGPRETNPSCKALDSQSHRKILIVFLVHPTLVKLKDFESSNTFPIQSNLLGFV